MSDHEKPALTEGEIETMAWDLETKMMKIRKDPQAALAEGLAKIRAQQLAEMRALWAKVEAEILAKRDAVLAQLEESRCARTEPAEPPPMMMKSYTSGISVCFQVVSSACIQGSG